LEAGMDGYASASRRNGLRHLCIWTDFAAGNEFGAPDFIDLSELKGTLVERVEPKSRGDRI
jgi:hypothetical protein